MCPKIEIMDSGTIKVPTTIPMAQVLANKTYEIATLGDAAQGDQETASKFKKS
jgi:hypothetical protein